MLARSLKSSVTQLPRHALSTRRPYSAPRDLTAMWRFAPLNPEVENAGNKPLLAGIVFDVDGTLCEPQNYMFAEMREALGITKSVDILDHVHSLSAADQEEAQAKLQAIERKAMKVQKPQPGLTELMSYLDSRGVRKGICTRNFDEPVAHLLTTFIPETVIAPIITRAFHPPKPDPAGILHIANQWALPGNETGQKLIMVGDSIDDMTAGSRAGAMTVLLVSEANGHLVDHDHTDIYINRLDDLIPMLETGTARGHEVV